MTKLPTWLFPWSSALLEKPAVAQPLKTFPVFYGIRKFLPFSQDPSTGLYIEPQETNPHPNLFLKD
jgi:hypothetical protein